ncbi:MAG: alpha/beta hydrolase [Acidimicrobiales bacterium]|jgi:pimeloyl-ACP methyl ester carboxylesterase|nr:alpha/beta hydrolase [Acidimicrobiales bacterium]
MTDAAHDAARGEAVRVGDLNLWADQKGDPGEAAVLLIAGADSPGFRWTPAIVDRLIEDGFQVIRFDHRDCGRSTRFGADSAYLLDDLVADAVGLLDHYAIDAAHVVGRSMGGMIGQLLALDHADRVLSLTMFGSSPAPGDDRLPGPMDEFVEKMTERLFAGPPRDDDGRVQWLIELDDFMAGSAYPIDADHQAALAAAEIATGWAAETGHGIAVHASPDRLDRLSGISAPTMVIHGTADPVFPPAHGRALATGIDGAILVEVEGLGHEVPDALIEELWPAIQKHLHESARWNA